MRELVTDEDHRGGESSTSPPFSNSFTMGPLPTGPRNTHIQKSHGADTNVMKFYVTQNSTTYGKHWQNFKPRMGRHSGTGYSANFRPQVYYSTKLDEVDNPTLG